MKNNKAIGHIEKFCFIAQQILKVRPGGYLNIACVVYLLFVCILLAFPSQMFQGFMSRVGSIVYIIFSKIPLLMPVIIPILGLANFFSSSLFTEFVINIWCAGFMFIRCCFFLFWLFCMLFVWHYIWKNFCSG